jgi:iron complex outermembrane receptor protein
MFGGFSRSGLMGAASVAVIMAMAPAAHALEAQKSFDIRAQGAADGLLAFSHQSDIQVVTASADLSGARTQPVQGVMTPRRALERLLAGTGLRWRSVGYGSVVIEPSRRLIGSGQATAADPARVSEEDTALVDEVVVTASKRAERLHDVPSSVTALTSQSLQGIGAAKFEDYVARIPGLAAQNVQLANGTNQLDIRGVTTGVGGNPTVGIYVDDLPFGSSTGFGGFNVPDLDPQDLERVEVLRGPQGTLYGAGSLGGLLKYVTAAPDTSHFFGRVQVDGQTIDGGGSGYGVRGSVNLPVSDQLALRLSAYHREDPGFVDNVLTGQKDINTNEFTGGRAALGWQINQDWKVRLSAFYQQQEGQGPIVDYDPVTFKPTYGDLKQWRGYGTNVGKQRMAAFAASIEGDLGFATLTSATSYAKQKMNFNIDGTELYGGLIDALFGIPDVGAAISSNVTTTKFTQELRLASPATNTLAWQIGAFYTDEDVSSQQLLPLFNPLTGETLNTGLPTLLDIDGDFTFKEIAVFGDATYHFSPRFDVTVGARYSRNRQTNTGVNDGLLVGGFAEVDVQSKDNSVTFLVTPRFRINDDTMAYARIASGFRPGGPNAAAGSPGVNTSFGPDRVVNYEIGVKTDLLDKRLTLDVAAYYIDWTKIQLQQISPLGLSYLNNAGSAVSKGIEAAATWRPVHGLQIDANFALNEATLGADLPAGGQVGEEGDRLPLTARWKTNVGFDYSVPLFGDWSGRVGASWRHVGDTLGAFPNPGLPRFEHPAYDVVDLRAGVNNDRWSLMVFAKNIGDDRGQSADLAFGSSTRVSVIQPRTFAVSLAATF